ncbi:hypothetical protein PIB30_036617 [Stylosanthes scabra]|uniref:FAR1 domain-containing protein n=1 Tax=Stylosanthes scabra TaxID=79078 RepID=A0ABU6RDX7_9FABA|nr:hypothetical protein [Stylosanthes scabra]
MPCVEEEEAVDFDGVSNSSIEDVISHSCSCSEDNHNNSDEVTQEPLINAELKDWEVLRFGTLEEARKFYWQFASKSGFIPKIRTTNWATIDGTRVPVGQLYHCNKDGYHQSRVNAPKKRKPVASANCKARCYVVQNRVNG